MWSESIASKKRDTNNCMMLSKSCVSQPAEAKWLGIFIFPKETFSSGANSLLFALKCSITSIYFWQQNMSYVFIDEHNIHFAWMVLPSWLVMDTLIIKLLFTAFILDGCSVTMCNLPVTFDCMHAFIC